MKLRFSIHYRTAWGESLHVVIGYGSRDGRQRWQNLPMQTVDGDLWTLETAVMASPQKPVASFTYFYQVERMPGSAPNAASSNPNTSASAHDEDCLVRREWNVVKRTYAFDATKDYILADSWRDEVPTWCEPMMRDYSRTTAVLRLPVYRKTVFLRVRAPQLASDEWLAVCGNHPSMGEWNPQRYLSMTYVGNYEWLLSMNVDNIELPIYYKYVVIDRATRQLKRWEEGDDRYIDAAMVNREGAASGEPVSIQDHQVMVVGDDHLRITAASRSVAGIIVPVFALRYGHCYGVGDFGSLRQLADWAVQAGIERIQLSALTDSERVYSHPLHAVSLFALHPHYLDLSQLPPLRHDEDRRSFEQRRRELQAMTAADYEAVERVKADYVDRVFAEWGEATMQEKDFNDFMAANGEWLKPYAELCAQGSSPLRRSVRKTWFVQYHLHRQLQAATEYAQSKGVLITGDFPIGVSETKIRN